MTADINEMENRKTITKICYVKAGYSKRSVKQ